MIIIIIIIIITAAAAAAAATTAVNHRPYRCKKIKLVRTAHITCKVLGYTFISC
jgi:hypothetical protein